MLDNEKPGRTGSLLPDFSEGRPCKAPGCGEVHIWRLDMPDDIARRWLTLGEKDQAAAMREGAARRSFKCGRAGVRRVAGIYLGESETLAGLALDGRGKPHFDPPNGLYFNLSHTDGHVFAAFSGEPVGLDIERQGREGGFVELAERFFHQSEARAIGAAGAGGGELFLRHWTAKEAMLKLSGDGLAGGLVAARWEGAGRGSVGGRSVYLRHFVCGGLLGCVALFSTFEVNGWYDLPSAVSSPDS